MEHYADFYGQLPLVSSAGQTWPGVRVEQYHLEPLTLPATYHPQAALLLYQPEVPMQVREPSGRYVVRAGNLGLCASGEAESVTWDVPTRNITLFLEEAHLEQVARQGLDLQHFQLLVRKQFDDPLLLHLGRQLAAAAGSAHSLGRLYVESLTNALFYQLIAHHATYERRIHPTGGRPLTAAVLARLEAYLEAHPDEHVTLDTLAGLANLSVFHFARLFKQATGTTPYQYVLAWKIKRAQQLLRAGELPIEVISDLLGFASPTNFSAAFKRSLGQSPRAYQRG